MVDGKSLDMKLFLNFLFFFRLSDRYLLTEGANEFVIGKLGLPITFYNGVMP